MHSKDYEYELIKYVEREISGVVTQIAFHISYYLELPLFEKIEDKIVNLTEKIHRRFDAKNTSASGNESSVDDPNSVVLRIQGKVFNYGISVMLFELFFLLIAIFPLPMIIFDPQNLVIYLLLSTLFLLFCIVMYKGTGFTYEIIIKEKCVELRKHRHFYFDTSVNIKIENIISIIDRVSAIEIVHTQGREEVLLFEEEDKVISIVAKLNRTIGLQIP